MGIQEFEEESNVGCIGRVGMSIVCVGPPLSKSEKKGSQPD